MARVKCISASTLWWNWLVWLKAIRILMIYALWLTLIKLERPVNLLYYNLVREQSMFATFLLIPSSSLWEGWSKVSHQFVTGSFPIKSHLWSKELPFSYILNGMNLYAGQLPTLVNFRRKLTNVFNPKNLKNYQTIMRGQNPKISKLKKN